MVAISGMCNIASLETAKDENQTCRTTNKTITKRTLVITLFISFKTHDFRGEKYNWHWSDSALMSNIENRACEESTWNIH